MCHYLFYYWTLELFREFGIIVFFIFLLDFGTVPTVWQYLFLYGTLELFRQCGIICVDMGLWNSSDSVTLFIFILDFGSVPTVWHYLL